MDAMMKKLFVMQESSVFNDFEVGQQCNRKEEGRMETSKTEDGSG